jgi:hypothetical protein
MMSKKTIGLLAGVLVLGFGSVAWAGIPNLDNSYATTSATQQVSLMICPACDGDDLLHAQDCSGGTVDATVTLTVLDINYDPVVGYPETDLWIVANGICVCPADPPIADGPTDLNGQTTFTGTICGGGCSDDSSFNVYINPYGVLNHPGLDILINSPDMSCDLVVNLTDLSLFAACYAACDYCCDFYCDGACTLSDVVKFAAHYQHVCP